MCLLHSKGWRLRYLPGWGNPHHCIEMLYVGEVSKREQCHLLISWQLSVTSPDTHKKIGPFWCWFPGGWVCVRSRTLWVSPMSSPARLGVSPAASTPIGFSVRGFEALFLHAGTLNYMVCLAPQLFLLVYLYTNVGAPGPPATALLRVLSTPAAHLWHSYMSE